MPSASTRTTRVGLDPQRLLEELDFERLAGTPGERRAVDIIVGHLKHMKLRPRIESFEINGFDSGSAVLEADGRSYEVHPFGMEKTRSIEGELVFLENADVLAYNQGAFRDKVVLVYTSTQRLQPLLAEAGVKACIGISAPHRGNYSLSHRQKLYADGKAVPSVTISYDEAEKLIRALPRRARIRIKQKVEKRRAHNVVVTVGKARRDSTLTYLVGHYDTVSRSHGSVDNAGGTVCLLKAAEHFAAHPPERELRIIFCGAEELGLLGSSAYVASHEKEVRERGRLVVNVDVSGEVIGEDLYIVLGSRELLGWVGGASRESGLMFKESLDVYSSDCMPFAVHEIPSVNIARMGGKANHFIHTADDTARYVSAAGIENTYRATEVLLGRLLGASIYPIRKEIDDSLREKIEKYLWGLRYEKPELKWVEKYRR